MTIDLNCDMGESFGRYSIGNDAEIMSLISSCNIACGFHAGDPKVLIETIKAAYNHGVKIGAHPSYPDRQGFGRRKMKIDPNELVAIIQYQVAVIDKLSNIYADGMHHVKPHGALYNDAFKNKDVAHAIVKAITPWINEIVLYAQFNSVLYELAKEAGIKVKAEGFIDRNYEEDLSLMSRSKPGAVHQNISTMIDQALSIVIKNKINTSSGPKSIHVDTLCIHGDHPQAVEVAKIISTALKNEGVTIQ